MPRKVMQGVVISSGKMNKTVKVAVSSIMKHPLYGKYLRRIKKYLVHDEKNECKVGDIVLIRETRPISKLKRFYVANIIRRGTTLETVDAGTDTDISLSGNEELKEGSEGN